MAINLPKPPSLPGGELRALPSELAEAELDRQRIARQQQQQAGQQDGYTSIFDRFWTDDFSAIPLIGPASSAMASGITNFYDRVNQGYSYAAGQLTGQNVTPELAREVTPGQVFEARARGIDITNEVDRKANWGPTNINVLSEDFSVNWASGLIDTAVAWYLDPLVLLGKATKVTRVGTNFGRTGRLAERLTGADPLTYSVSGLSRKRMNIAGPRVAEMAQTQVDAAFMGGQNRASFLADEIVSSDYDDLLSLVDFQGSSRDLLASVGARINDRTDALNFIGAATGSPKYIERLQKTRADLFVEMLRSTAPNQYEALALRVGESRLPAFFDEPLERSIDVDNLVANMRKSDPDLDAALLQIENSDRMQSLTGAIDLLGENIQPIEQLGSNWVKGAQISAAWRKGRTQRISGKERRQRKRMASMVDEALQDGKIGLEEAGILQDVTRTGTRPVAYETVYQVSSRLPKVRVWTWMTGSRAAGLIDVRGMETGQSSTEMKAALSDSVMLRNDPEFSARMLDEWGSAMGAKDRYAAAQRIELQSFRHMYELELRKVNMAKQERARKLHAKGRIDDDELARRIEEAPLSFAPDQLPGQELLDEAYRLIDTRRAEAIEKVRAGRAYLIDENGDIVRTDPRLRSQLETKLPMLDFSKLEDTAKILAKFADKSDPVSYAVGNFRRKQSAALAKGGLDTALSLWKASVLLRLGYTQRNVLEGWLRSMASIGLAPMVARIPAWSVNFSMNTYRRLGWRQRNKLLSQEEQMIKDIASMQKGIDDMIADGVAAGDPEMIAAKQSIDAQKARIEEIRSQRKELQKRDSADTKRKVGDLEFSAFGGPEGDVVRELTSMARTNQQFLESSLMREQDLIMSASNYVKVTPDKPQYYDELNQSVVQFQSDEVARRLLEARAAGSADPVGDVVAWARSGKASYWRRDMKINQRQVEGAVVDINNMISRYLPTSEAVTVAATTKNPGALVLREAIEPNLQGYPEMLTAIHGREVREALSKGQTLGEMGRKPLDWIFNVIGNLPETTLVRHPYYATVWSREFDSIMAVAQRQGVDLTEEVLMRIDRTAKTRALRNLKDTLYTIERLSNPAHLFRFMVPFFPAWENSMKAWGRMVVNDPSIAVRASILWDLPNQLGMVVDSEGRPVESDRMDFLTGSTEKYIRLPSGVNKWIMENISGGIPVAIPQGAINVVTPGETPFLPGFGPVVQVPASLFLRTKPDTQRILRDQLPAEIYNQIAPFGQVPSVGDAIMPSAVRKAIQLIQGEDNDMYLGIADAMLKAEFVDWYRNGANPALKPDIDEIMERTQQFQMFSIGASLVAPFAVTRNSKYQVQEDYWRQLMADPTMTYRQKTEQFVDKFGVEFLPMIESTSEKASPMIGNTIESFEVIDRNRSLVETVSVLDPRAVGVLTAGTQSGEFDQGVYQFWGITNVPGTRDRVRRRRTPQEMREELLMAQAWREYREMKDLRDDALAQMGVSLQSNDAAGVKAQWDQFTDVQMVEKYGEVWSVNFNQFNDLTPSYINAINLALNDRSFMEQRGNTQLWQGVSQYMNERRMAREAIAAGVDSATVREQFAAWAEQFRYSSLEFSDFYDNFLENDGLIEYGEENVYVNR